LPPGDINVLSKDYKDVLGGGLLFATGAYALGVALFDLPIGPLGRMGPGMFPALAGGVVTTLGLGITLSALQRRGTPARVGLRSTVCLLGAILLFSLLIPRFGLVPAVMVASLTAIHASDALRLPGKLLLAAGLALIAVLLFGYGFQLQVPLFDCCPRREKSRGRR
jgi:hypothetical protein